MPDRRATGARVLMGPRRRSAVRPQMRRPGRPMAFMVRRIVREVGVETSMVVLAKVLIWVLGWVRRG
jgi:hypothetical protein